MGANLSSANLARADFSGADLREAKFIRADLSEAKLIRADLRKAELSDAHLRKVDLSGANLTGGYLDGAALIGTVLDEANLTGCNVYGVSVWDIRVDRTIQSNLVITPEDQSAIQMDNLEVAQFVCKRRPTTVLTQRMITSITALNARDMPQLDRRSRQSET